MIDFLFKVSDTIFASTGISKSIELRSFPRTPLRGVARKVQMDVFISTSRDMPWLHQKRDPHVAEIGVIIELKKSNDTAANIPCSNILSRYLPTSQIELLSMV